MTRIVAGEFGGRTLIVPPSGTRPTPERVREAIFSRLTHWDVLDDAVVLDIFAGTGALGLEALSRGAAHATLIDKARPAAAAMRRNISALGVRDRTAVVTKPAAAALRSIADQGAPRAHIVFLDPPYELAERQLTNALRALDGVVADEAIVVVERDSRSHEPTWPAPLTEPEARRYGDTTVWFATWHAAAATVGPRPTGPPDTPETTAGETR